MDEKFVDAMLGTLCRNCEHQFVECYEEPCRSCLKSKEIRPNWEPKDPNLKELYKKYTESEDKENG